ncbi:MAG: hypothetical protein IJ209_04295 [Bacteroidaceae bacterium]|nr:hypothetical protein [Bacteroidaceae bacterium]
MNYKLYISVLLFALLPAVLPARELVITLKNGERAAFHLSEDNKQTACLTLTDDAVTINGVNYARSDFKELRIYKELPEGVDIVDAVQGINAEAPADNAVYDLSGRRIGQGLSKQKPLRKGIYIVNHKKVVKP